MKKWRLPKKLTTEQNENKNQIKSFLKCPEIIAEILVRKNLLTEEEINDFFYPELKDLHDPYLFKDMDKAVSRILKAIKNQERIVIFGDYDVDGTTSTAILYLGLSKLNAIVDYCIPHRIDDGFGLTDDMIRDFKENKTDLIITVDYGINCVEETNTINKNNMEIIITDHHITKDKLPDAFAIINPKLENCEYPNKNLAGVGVAFKLLMAIFRKIGIYNKKNIKKYIELVAVGTIADIVPLVGENRTFAKEGLKKILKKRNIGLTTLINIAGLSNKYLNTGDIIYALAPRINAAGRMGSAMRSVELMIERDSRNAELLAEIIERENSLRQQIEYETFLEACDIISKKYKNLDQEYCIIISSQDWHPGIIGILASKIVERYHRPTIIISFIKGNEIGVGSARSVDNFDIFKALTNIENILETFGGHKYAVGLSIKMENIDRFENVFSREVAKNINLKELVPVLNLEYEIQLYQINLQFLEWLDKFAPFGVDNQRPLFYTRAVMISGYPYTVGSNHIKLRVKKDGCELELIGFNFGKFLPNLKKNKYIDITYYIELDKWQNKKSIKGKLCDIHFL